MYVHGLGLHSVALCRHTFNINKYSLRAIGVSLSTFQIAFSKIAFKGRRPLNLYRAYDVGHGPKYIHRACIDGPLFSQ